MKSILSNSCLILVIATFVVVVIIIRFKVNFHSLYKLCHRSEREKKKERKKHENKKTDKEKSKTLAS